MATDFKKIQAGQARKAGQTEQAKQEKKAQARKAEPLGPVRAGQTNPVKQHMAA